MVVGQEHAPLFRREPAIAEKQAIQDAANALTALWKIREPTKRWSHGRRGRHTLD
jgi:hypothetical protein